MKVLVDTNVLLRIAQPLHPQRPDALNATTRLLYGGWELCLVPQVLYEYWVVATRPENVNGPGLDQRTAEQALDQLIESYRLLRDERGIFGQWRQLLAGQPVLGKPAHDARLVAAMIRHGLTRLLTFNTRDFSRFPEITAVAPADVLTQTPLH